MQLLDLMYRNGLLQCFPQLFYATGIYGIKVLRRVLSGMRSGDVVALEGPEVPTAS